MRSEQEMLELILGFTSRDDNIRPVLMNGSRANPNAPKDPFQDFDILCLVRDVTPYVRNRDIPPMFGEIMIVQLPDDMVDPPPVPNGHYAYLMQYMDGNRIDLNFHLLSKIEAVIHDSLTIVLQDKDGILRNVPPSSDKDYLPKAPTEKAFQDFGLTSRSLLASLGNISKRVWRRKPGPSWKPLTLTRSSSRFGNPCL